MVVQMLDGKMSLHEILRQEQEKMTLQEAMRLLEGKLPRDVAALVGTGKASQVPKMTEEALQKARTILNSMIEASFQSLDDTTVECQDFKTSNRRTFDQVATDLARLGADMANLDKAIATALSCLSDQETAFRQVQDHMDKERLQQLHVESETAAELKQKMNGLAVFDFIIDATKCVTPNATNKALLAQLDQEESGPGVVSVCESNAGFDLKFDDPHAEAKVMAVMTDEAKLALREALGLTFAANGEVPPAALFQQDSLVVDAWSDAQAPEKKKSPRVNCSVDVFENGWHGGWKATFTEGSYSGDAFLKNGAKDNQVSSVKVTGPCVAILYENADFTGWEGILPTGTYNLNAMVNRGVANDAASSLRVYPETYLTAKKACEAFYGECKEGLCGDLMYFYNKNSNPQQCSCKKPAGEYEFIWRNMGATTVGQDYQYDPSVGANVTGRQLFTRRKLLDDCSHSPVWELMDRLVVTSTPRPIPSMQAPVQTDDAPRNKALQYRRCSPVRQSNNTCGILHDTMSVQWGKFRDAVDALQAEIHQNEDTWKALQDNFNEQLRIITGTKSSCQTKFAEAISQKNVLVQEGSDKSSERIHLAKEYETRMASCKAKIEDLLYTDICAVRTVRNSLLLASKITPPTAVVDCEVGDWVAGDCSKTCDNSCPRRVGREIDPFQCGGTMKLVRTPIVSNNKYGTKCPSLARVVRCAQYKCPMDCKLSEWSGWSRCTKDCEGGSQQQTRSVLVKPRFGGQACGSTVETRACNMMSCDRDCSLADWSPWSPCSMSCNPGGAPGTQSRKRAVLVPIRGEGKCPSSRNPARYEEKTCNENLCVGDEVCVAKEDLIIAIDASGSIRESNFKVIREFALQVVKRYRSKYYGASTAKIGVILFGNGAKGGANTGIASAINVIGLTSKLDQVEKAIRNTTWQKGFTNLAQAFVLADTMFTQGGRASARSAVLVLSDGRYSFAFETQTAATRLKDKNTVILMAPISEHSGEWQAKLKQWTTQPWQQNYMLIPGFATLKANMEHFAGLMIARFCPKSVSPYSEARQDIDQGFMLIHREGKPDKNCGKSQELGYVSGPMECMAKVTSTTNYQAFVISQRIRRGRHCFAVGMQFGKQNYTTWASNKTSTPCPGGAWTTNPMFDTYLIEPLVEDPPSRNSTMPGGLQKKL